jgi:PAS domain S-box-containing protein
MRLVVVEDHPMILNVITMALQAVPGYEVVACQSAEAGLAACDSTTDLAIFDNRLPGLTGIEAVQRLRASPQTLHLPVIIITGDNDRQTRLDAIRAGATEFLEKPLQIDELRLRVRNLLALHAAQKQASEGQALLETLIAASGASIAVADLRQPDAPIVYASAPLVARTGRDAQAILGQPVRGLWADALPPDRRALLDQALGGERSGRFVLSDRPDDGAAAWTEVALVPVCDSHGAARHLMVTLRDVTDLVETRQAHDRLSSRLADIARISGAWFFEIDADLRLTYVSAAMAQELGTAPERLEGLHVGALPVRLADPARRGAPAATLFAPPHGPVEQAMVTLRQPDGTIRAVQIGATPFHDDQGRFAGYRGHAGDVSEIARARDLAAQASRAKSVFLATMSHEMRTPLTAIVGLSEVMARDSLPEAQGHQLDEIRAAALRLSDVLSDVLDVAGMEQGQLRLDLAAFDPVQTVVQALAADRDTARAKGLDFSFATTGGPAGARMGDAARVGRIVRALVSNAVKFTGRGTVTVALNLSDDGIELSVADTGIGMAPEDQQAAFRPFVQADDGIARRFEGAGLGLSIVAWLTAAMAGQIDLASMPGLGTTVRVRLPLPPAARPANPDKGASAEGWSGLAGRRVLVADDNLVNRRVLHALLDRLGAETVLCEDGPEALAAGRGGAFDLVLLDINMPGMAGTEVIRAIRRAEAERGTPPVPAIAVTANARPDQVAQYLEAGFAGCLAKPYTGAGLVAILRQHMAQPVG